MELTALRHEAQSPALPALHRLIHACFAPLDARIDPPSSVAALTPALLAQEATEGELWSLGDPPRAAMILRLEPDHLYVSKLAVSPDARRQGLALRLLALAEHRAHHLGKTALELQCRVELTENHAVFRRAGFAETGRRAHPGFDRPTSVSFRKELDTGIRPTD